MSNPNGSPANGNAASTQAPLAANEAAKSTPSVTPEQVEYAKVLAELAAVKQQLEAAKSARKSRNSIGPLTFKVSETSDCICVYGLQRLPTSLRRDQWIALLDEKENLLKYLATHADEIDEAEEEYGRHRRFVSMQKPVRVNRWDRR